MNYKINWKNLELLAPAGSFETLESAINAGADAVYLGIGNLNMRATAAMNFTLNDLPEIRKRTKKAGVKVYITLNTVIYNSELKEIDKILDKIKANNIDAIIASDMAVITKARELGIEVHISTQLSISNTRALEFYAQFADRIVLARELQLPQIKKISEDIQSKKIKGPKGRLVELEAFVHGAMCVAVSGRCAMSLYHYNRSANRGQCVQMCRRKYKVTDIETGKEMVIDNNYVMSAADLCTVGMLKELLESGINVLKIEGRGRSADYVDTVVKTYREVLTSLKNNTYTKAKIKLWNDDLKTVYNRGQSPGFYLGRRIDEWAYGSDNKAIGKKVHIGKVLHFYPKINVAEILIQADDVLKEGDKFMIVGPTTGILKGVVKNMLLDNIKVQKAKQQDVITLKVSKRVRTNDQVFIKRNVLK